MSFRRLVVAVFALLLAAQVVRSAAVRALAEFAPDRANRIWPDHPDVKLALGMTSIALATRRGQAITSEVLGPVYSAAARAPLLAEPYLVRGVQAQFSGDQAAAEQAFLAAKWRDGRSLPARYFLADLYFRRGDAGHGLPEMGALARLAPDGVLKVAPFMATYARNRANWPQVRALFRSEPRLEEATLRELSADAADADTALALADPKRRGPSSVWLPSVLSSLTKAGEYDKARRIWANIARVPMGRQELLHDPRFTDPGAPPPFNWALTSSTVGLAERVRGGGLHVIYYGQEDGALAAQLLVLRTGRYRLSASLASGSNPADTLQWRLLCDRTNATIASIPIRVAAQNGWRFEVPSTCPGQRLELFGSSSDVPRQVEFTVRALTLTHEGPNG